MITKHTSNTSSDSNIKDCSEFQLLVSVNESNGSVIILWFYFAIKKTKQKYCKTKKGSMQFNTIFIIGKWQCRETVLVPLKTICLSEFNYFQKKNRRLIKAFSQFDNQSNILRVFLETRGIFFYIIIPNWLKFCWVLYYIMTNLFEVWRILSNIVPARRKRLIQWIKLKLLCANSFFEFIPPIQLGINSNYLYNGL